MLPSLRHEQGVCPCDIGGAVEHTPQTAARRLPPGVLILAVPGITQYSSSEISELRELLEETADFAGSSRRMTEVCSCRLRGARNVDV